MCLDLSLLEVLGSVNTPFSMASFWIYTLDYFLYDHELSLEKFLIVDNTKFQQGQEILSSGNSVKYHNNDIYIGYIHKKIKR